jgi:pimeloyl-ACP methyl ester carboxylesterase
MQIRYTTSRVRMRLYARTEGPLNWLLLPGGPGIGSESLEGLAQALDVPGAIWLIDLPGDGSNIVEGDAYAKWPGVLMEAAVELSDVVYIGHSTGGAYLLSCPELRGKVRGIGLLDTAPNCDWYAKYLQMTKDNPLPEFDAAMVRYLSDRTQASLAALCVASAEWNFSAAGVEAGRSLLAAMPYNAAAVEWSEKHFDHSYCAAWWPEVPLLRLAGAEDRIVSQDDWSATQFHTPNALHRVIPGAGHFPWVENPQAVTEAFRSLARAIEASGSQDLRLPNQIGS